jgi:hypothetical protein
MGPAIQRQEHPAHHVNVNRLATEPKEPKPELRNDAHENEDEMALKLRWLQEEDDIYRLETEGARLIAEAGARRRRMGIAKLEKMARQYKRQKR